jgi:hypothetical protein
VEHFYKKWVEEVVAYIKSKHGDCIEVFTDPPRPKLNSRSHIDELVQQERISQNASSELGEIVAESVSDVYPGDVCSIISIRVKVDDQKDPGKKRYLTQDEYKKFHGKLMVPLGPLATTAVSIEACKADCSNARVMLGQAVPLVDESSLCNNGGTVLRIALGADIVVSSLQPAQGVYYGYPSTGQMKQGVSAFEGRNPCQASAVSARELDNSDDENDIGICGDEIWDLEVALSSVISDDMVAVDKIAWLASNWHTISSSQVYLPNADGRLAARFTAIDKLLHLTNDYFSTQLCETANTATSEERVSAAVRKLVTDQRPTNSASSLEVGMMLDIDALTSAFLTVRQAFGGKDPPNSWLHCFAVKSCPISYVLHLAGILVTAFVIIDLSLTAGVSDKWAWAGDSKYCGS